MSSSRRAGEEMHTPFFLPIAWTICLQTCQSFPPEHMDWEHTLATLYMYTCTRGRGGMERQAGHGISLPSCYRKQARSRMPLSLGLNNQTQPAVYDLPSPPTLSLLSALPYLCACHFI